MTDIMTPALGESVTEATVARWAKKPGDRVAIEEPHYNGLREALLAAGAVLARVRVPGGERQRAAVRGPLQLGDRRVGRAHAQPLPAAGYRQHAYLRPAVAADNRERQAPAIGRPPGQYLRPLPGERPRAAVVRAGRGQPDPAGIPVRLQVRVGHRERHGGPVR